MASGFGAWGIVYGYTLGGCGFLGWGWWLRVLPQLEIRVAERRESLAAMRDSLNSASKPSLRTASPVNSNKRSPINSIAAMLSGMLERRNKSQHGFGCFVAPLRGADPRVEARFLLGWTKTL